MATGGDVERHVPKGEWQVWSVVVSGLVGVLV